MGASKPINCLQEDDYNGWNKSVNKQYGGGHHWTPELRRFHRPTLEPDDLKNRKAELLQNNQERSAYKIRYRNIWGEREHSKYPDLDAYYSSTKGYPRRLLVQATDPDPAHLDTRPRHWGQSRLKSHIPSVLWLSELCLNPLGLEQYDGSLPDEDEAEPRRAKKSVARQIKFALIEWPLHWILSILLKLLLGWIIALLVFADLVSSPWTDDSSVESYKEYENVDWEWPKHAVNMLDQSPNNTHPQSHITHIIVPRRLVVRVSDKGDMSEWEVRDTSKLRDEHTGMLPPYVFLSFSRKNYRVGEDESPLRSFFNKVAHDILKEENRARSSGEPEVNAFWVDTECVIPDSKGSKSRDINTICDAVRFAKRVYILLPSDSKDDKKRWGNRMWTLPEVLLAAEKIRYWVTPSWLGGDVSEKWQSVSLNDMYESFWPSRLLEQRSIGDGLTEEKGNAIHYLLDHYTNRTKLSDLQLFTFAVQALAQLESGDAEGYTKKDLAYAAMGLMEYRITPYESDSVFQAISRLSLVNDSDRLLERLLCMFPYPSEPVFHAQGITSDVFANNAELLGKVADRDQYGTHLWDIHPLCDVVGVAAEKLAPTVIINRCRGIPIRWKDFPKLKYTKNRSGFKAMMSKTVLYFAALFIVTGFSFIQVVVGLAFTLLPFSLESQADQTVQTVLDQVKNLQIQGAKSSLYGVAVFLGLGVALAMFSPLAVRNLCNDGSKGVSCHLVGFEGTLPVREIEKIIYGNYRRRLSYAASTTPFSVNLRAGEIRLGVEPKDQSFWKEECSRLKISPGHRLFTIVDTGSLTVSVIAAERPPVVALICGREGGMLRTLLCSWRFETNTLYREAVMRMRSSLEDISSPNDWLKVSLASQGDVNRLQIAASGLRDSSCSAPPAGSPLPPSKGLVFPQHNIL